MALGTLVRASAAQGVVAGAGGNLASMGNPGLGRTPGAAQRNGGILDSLLDTSSDVSDLIYGGSMRGLGAGGPAAVDPDEELDPGQRRQRMRACLIGARSWMLRHQTEAEGAISEVLAQSSAAGAAQQVDPDMAEEQASSQILFALVMSCYQEVDQGAVQEARQSGGGLPEDVGEAIFSLSKSAPRPTRRQYDLVESVMREYQQELAKDNAMGRIPGTMNIVGQGMSPLMRVVYVSVVIGVCVAAGLWAWFRVARERPARQRSEKATKRVIRAEKLLAKKKFA